ncbi:MAG: hypothetical protein BWK75_03355 [Candidatus Altiarchaeales archaeon A3]|nr:MAG: hypothetical protein BWK75_03355 [Candidatus Altiarchaeales archaeon A3]
METKKIIFALLLLILPLVTVFAWDNCPFGEVVNCTYPGDCNKYIDADNDGICDYSQPAPENRINNVTNNLTNKVGASAKSDVTEITEKSAERPAAKETYHLLQVSLLLIILYLISYVLSKKNAISIATHRKIWNVLLLITFFISGLLGVLLMIKIDFGIVISLPFDILFWHVEAGIIMVVISIFHILWHWQYFKNILKI